MWGDCTARQDGFPEGRYRFVAIAPNGDRARPPAIGPDGTPQSLRAILSDPANLIAVPVLVLFAVGQRAGFIASVPLWLLLGSLFLAQVGSAAFALAFPPGTPRARPVMHVATEIALIGVVIYATGWGAVLAVGFVYSVGSHLDVDGSSIGRPAIILSLAAIAIGEAGIALGWIPTLLPEPQGHGVALLEAAGVVAVLWIVSSTQRQKELADAGVRRSEERLQALVRHAADAIVVIDAEAKVAYASPAVERMLGYPPEGFERFDQEIIHPDHLEGARSMFGDVLTRPRGSAWIELPLRHVNGRFHWCEVRITNLLDDPAVGGLVCNMRDVTDRRRAQEELQFQAHHDALTRLPNRWLFLDQLERAQTAAATRGTRVAVLFLDVDRFKLVNDSLGHEAGDRMLVLVAERLTACLRPDDLVARFGGDEFTILLNDLEDADAAMVTAERVTQTLREPLIVDGHELFVSASLGVALSRGGDTCASDLLREADLAMYVAKERGRARWELFDPSFTPTVIERLELEGELWRALEHGELTVHFQPEVTLESGRVRAAEALIRWNHPRRGLVEPEGFIPFAEESALIVAIDRYVLREACAWARRWSTWRPDGRPFVVSVNLSPRFMRQADLVAEVTGVLHQSGVDPRAIQLEITERSALTDVEATCGKLHELRALGVRVAVDDFGTGYSSLSYLKMLPIDVLKLDKSFVDGLDSEPSDTAIVQAIVTMGHALGVEVTAEGVERPEQVVRLRALGCDAAMGWLWSRAVPPAELQSLAGSALLNDGMAAAALTTRSRG